MSVNLTTAQGFGFSLTVLELKIRMSNNFVFTMTTVMMKYNNSLRALSRILYYCDNQYWFYGNYSSNYNRVLLSAMTRCRGIYFYNPNN